MPGTPIDVLQAQNNNSYKALPAAGPAGQIMFTQLMSPGVNSSIFQLTEKGAFQINFNEGPGQQNNFGTVVLQNSATLNGTYTATSVSFTQPGAQYYYLPFSLVNSFFKFTNTTGGQVMVSMFDPFPDD